MTEERGRPSCRGIRVAMAGAGGKRHLLLLLLAAFLPVNQSRLDRGNLDINNNAQNDDWSDEVKAVLLQRNSTKNNSDNSKTIHVTIDKTFITLPPKAETDKASTKLTGPEELNESNMTFYAMFSEDDEDDDQITPAEELYKEFKPARVENKTAGHLIPFDDDDQGLYEYPFALPFDQSRCPPPVETTYLGILCSATECFSDSDCEGYRFCCYNGCVFTCTRITDSPPIELDWVEMGPKYPHYTVIDHSDGHIRESREGDEQEDSILLDGGCVLSMKQFEILKSFSQSEDIKRCFCENEDVLCEVRQWINPKILHKPHSISETWPDEIIVP